MPLGDPAGYDPAVAQQRMQARQASPGAPPPGPGVGDPNMARYMARPNPAMGMGNPAMPKGPPPQMRPMGGPPPGASPGAMGGAFSMRPQAPQRSPFAGGMTKAPMQTGQASPFAGGPQRGGNR
jgi:hypothetical protein